MKTWNIDSERAMLDLGERLGERLQPGDLLFLSGDLGAGKTTLTKGIAQGLEVTAAVTSPTFQLRKGYAGRIRLNHLDLYRLEKPSELAMLEPDELFEEGVTVVEWGDLLKANFPHDHLDVAIEYGPAEGERRVTLRPAGQRFDDLIKEL
ncbi:tRNA threonylcarbamoyladenosine biosynthesis protein TsaE [Hydrogenispora ethanolica]|jgi:tRNA threonylcarbamoyladenosine biosynthesis protein TsaE|uniref:tRNA threonylcarbamoyladenosine biosynthesis protein TsaE n=1 Tax=Hydrogenispora ethanolica TaxID=1082276 RepID=A0A4R1S220_HYDET|nr:tRNA (adenosine(37)-N6)-threonylcarbamoyltransferase complex ATPase subunit type 1 TsaE [Hydrogenispora ethanolica]TCL73213.1 tRNA threonylcarbamoyladenosine biosynthesis protein TsaE [Hydrogenispora ethanolica]